MRFKLLLKYNRLIILYTLVSISVANADDKNFRAIHSYYFGGFNVLESVTDFYANKSYYKISTESSTKGALNLVFDWKGIVNSEGIIKKSKLIPSNYKSLGRWGKEIWITNLTYNKSGQIASTKVSPLPDVEEIIPLPLNPGTGTIDPLSFISQFVINTTVNTSCEEENVIFDGRRRYKLKIKEIGAKNFSKTPYNIFKGKALDLLLNALAELTCNSFTKLFCNNSKDFKEFSYPSSSALSYKVSTSCKYLLNDTLVSFNDSSMTSIFDLASSLLYVFSS